MEINRKLSIAPMMDHTDRHCRYFLRLITRHTLLYSEMINSAAILNGNRDWLLAYSDAEHPLALQLGGSDPAELRQCATIADDYGYDEINLNVGCPSDRVQTGRFGACLMAEPELVAECIASMQQATTIPVTVKTRLGIDDSDSYDELTAFITKVSAAGCRTFIMHARKAWLKGLSPRENREVPPLNYSTVYQLKNDFPDLEIIINGGFTRLDQIQEQYKYVDGVMIGRAAYHDPYLLAEVDRIIFADKRITKTRHQILAEFMDYVSRQLDRGVALNHMTRHILGLYLGQPGARAYRRQLSQYDSKSDTDIKVLKQAVKQMT
jgi:tRNA-dihydrouridine synthase A